MKFKETKLPWNNSFVRSTGNLYTYFAERLPNSLGSYLPASLTLFFDPEIKESTVVNFLDEMTRQLNDEFHIREKRRDKFVELGLFNEIEIHSFLTGRRHLQPWALYYSKQGGLGISDQNTHDENSAYGVFPCTTMQNHGVAWRCTENGSYQVWLATARKVGHDWDWDSDVGHESGHAAFAQFPLFARIVNDSVPLSELSSVKSVKELNSGHLARMSYMYLEIAVVAMRGEKRETGTGLPVAERPEEFYAFLELSNQLMPRAGFKGALTAYNRVNGLIDVNNGLEMFEIGAAVMGVVPHITKVFNSFVVPTVDWYKSIELFA